MERFKEKNIIEILICQFWVFHENRAYITLIKCLWFTNNTERFDIQLDMEITKKLKFFEKKK